MSWKEYKELEKKLEQKKDKATRNKQIVIYSILSVISLRWFYSIDSDKFLLLIFAGGFSLAMIVALINCIFFNNDFSKGKDALQKFPPLEQDAKNAVKFGLGKCPSCFREVSRLATKCPHCTADL
jgi:hypothetical protein